MAFWGCENLEQITIPKSVTSIGSNAFYGCVGLEEVIIPESVTSIGDEAFRECKNLKQITIPESVTSIGSEAFYGCEGLKEVIIPESVTSIGDAAFRNCWNLKAVILPDSITRIEGGTFAGTSIESLTLPKSLTSIENVAFLDCGNLKNVTVPDSVTSIGYRAFSECKNLKSVTVPDSVTFIGDEAFWGTPWFENNTDEIVIRGKVIMKYNKEDEISITIPDHITGIYSGAFQCNNVEDITLPESVTSIDYEAFYYCNTLKSLTIHDSITQVGAFPLPRSESFKTLNIISNGTKYVIDVSKYDKEATRFRELILGACDFIKNKNYEAEFEPKAKYSLILDNMIFTDEEASKVFIQENFLDIVKWLIDGSDTKRLKVLIKNANFITEQNIDTFIDYAEEKKKRRMFNSFTKYKTENFGTAK